MAALDSRLAGVGPVRADAVDIGEIDELGAA